MIQIVSLRPYQGKITQKFLNPGVPIPSHSWLFAHYEEVCDRIKNRYGNELYNLFYTTAHHVAGARSRESYQYQDILPFDIDGIDHDSIGEYHQIMENALGTSIGKLGAVSTGNGLHYILQVPPLTLPALQALQKEYVLYLNVMNKELEVHGLPGKFDNVLDTGRVLRLPGTENRKPLLAPHAPDTKVRHCTLLQGMLKLSSFDLTSIGAALRSAPSREYPEVCDEAVVQGCGFLLAELESGGANSIEPRWFKAMGIASWLTKWQDYVVAVSSAHPKYDYNETLTKAEHCRESDGPRCCSSISEPECSGCQYKGLIKNPTQIRPSSAPQDVSRKEAENIQLARSVRNDSDSKNWNEWIRDGFTSWTGEEKKKIKREVNRLREYYEDLTHFKNIAGIKRCIIYENKYYRTVEKDEIKSFANTFYKPEVEKDGEREEFVNNVKTNCIGYKEFLDATPVGLINAANGIVDINKRELLPHSPAYGFQYILPYDYIPGATAPTWEKMLMNLCMDRVNLVETIEEYLGFCLAGGSYEPQKVLVLLGAGNNGKSTLLKAFQAVIGKGNYSNISISSLTRQFTPGGLEGKLANFSEDEKSSCFKDTSDFKKITGDTPIWVEHKFEKGFNLLNKAKIVMTFNKMPQLGDDTRGMKRRLIVIPFDVDLERDKDRYIPEISRKIDAELPGILNRALDGLHRLNKRGDFQVLQESNDAISEMALDSSELASWADEYVEITHCKSDIVHTDESFEHFNRVTGNGVGYGSLSKVSFGRDFTTWCRNLNIVAGNRIRIDGVRKRGAIGIKLKSVKK